MAIDNIAGKKMATITIAVQIGNENAQITKWLKNDLFFMSKKIIARKQIP